MHRASVIVFGATALVVLAGAVDTAPGQDRAPAGIRTIELDGRQVRLQALGLEQRRPGDPLVVFETGVANALEVWSGVVERVAASAPVLAYDRAGLGHSAWDEQKPVPRHVVDRQRRLLQRIDAPPPYLLVGYSWGAVLARYHAGWHPQDVAGLVLVDPGPIVTDSLDESLGPFEAVGSGRAGYDAYWSSFTAFFAQSPPAVRAELDVLRALMETEPADRDLLPVPEVPVVVLVSARYLPLPMELPFDPVAHHEADVRHRIDALREWALESPRGTLVVTNHSDHAVMRNDPDLVVWAVQRALQAVAGE